MQHSDSKKTPSTQTWKTSTNVPSPTTSTTPLPAIPAESTAACTAASSAQLY